MVDASGPPSINNALRGFQRAPQEKWVIGC